MAGFLGGLSAAQQIELVYIGYFERAADGGGYQWWMNDYSRDRAAGATELQALTRIADNFVPQTETLAQYPFLADAGNFDPTDPVDQANLGSFINDVYQNLFNRAPDAAGKAYWTNQILSGAVSVGQAILAIANGAGAGTDAQTLADAATLMNKVEASLDFTTRTSAEGLGYTNPLEGDFLAAAVEVINGVTNDDATVAAAAQETTDFINGTGPTDPHFLTTGIDNVVGGAGDDTIVADNSGADWVTQASDRVNGGEGVDTLHIYGGVGALPQLTSVENVVVENTNNWNNLNFSTAAGVQNVTLTGGAAGTLMVGADTAVTLESPAGNVTVNHLAADTSADVTLAGLSGQWVNIGGGGLTSATLTSSAVNAISGTNVASIGSASDVALTFAGDTSLRVANGLSNASIINTMGAATTLDIIVNTSGGDTSYVGGDGVDNVEAWGVLSATDKVGGGGGDADVLSIWAGTTASVKGISGFETLVVRNDGGATTLDLTDMNGANDLAHLIVQDWNATIADIDATAEVTLASGGGSAHVLTFEGQGLAGSDAATVILEDTSGTLSVANVDQLTLVSHGAAGATNVETLAANDLNSLTLEGDVALNLTLAGGTPAAFNLVDASAMTAGLTLNLAGAPGNVRIIQTAQADTLTLGPSANTVAYNAAGDSQLGDLDSISNFFVGFDKIDISALGFATKKLFGTADAVNADGTLVTAADATGFFNSGPESYDITYAVSGGNTFVYMDANHNHNLDADGDLVIKLAGVVAVTANEFVV